MTLEQYVTEEWHWRMEELEMRDPLMAAVAQRWQTLNAPERRRRHREAVAAVKAAEAAVQRLVEDRQAGLYDGAAGKHYPRLLKQAEADLATAQERQAKFAGPRIDLTVFDDLVMFQQMWEASDLSAKRDLLRIAIDRVTVTKAPGQGRCNEVDDSSRTLWAWITCGPRFRWRGRSRQRERAVPRVPPT
ncbi:hypothetical protein [Streptomyces noursei]|uniref:Uncharacterized protein n=1 Tax=Streptomyces noursei TaxID=1971 RepID=A0A2N8PJS5_STRNR|nr:hypothetical protein [Streptomyces noursei]PNE41279.1 hypothetical protein AOB60_11380 [Streptomyces noursei]